MFIDSSAVVEIILDADMANDLLQQIDAASHRYLGPSVIYEAAVVLSTRLQMEPAVTKLLVSKFIERFEIEILPASAEIAFAAVDAFARYGKGRHPAKLNFGDCFSYAGAKMAGVGLLYVGEDFALTDLA
jgi:ribonuclease VapC